MSVSLSKGQGVSLKKNEYDLSSVTIGLGWDINEEKKGFLGGIFGKKEEESQVYNHSGQKKRCFFICTSTQCR